MNALQGGERTGPGGTRRRGAILSQSQHHYNTPPHIKALTNTLRTPPQHLQRHTTDLHATTTTTTTSTNATPRLLAYATLLLLCLLQLRLKTSFATRTATTSECLCPHKNSTRRTQPSNTWLCIIPPHTTCNVKEALLYNDTGIGICLNASTKLAKIHRRACFKLKHRNDNTILLGPREDIPYYWQPGPRFHPKALIQRTILDWFRQIPEEYGHYIYHGLDGVWELGWP
ncbi:chemokine vCXCL4 [Panine betaherpesvirus 2]|uniref:Chemokine vCXCL4 n=1 Tax=Panine betaherpesvirus 2 TaxID=188763 RepID=Q8QRV8_9BETA|nr:chemokine vCXCL4 [Panine betaherpesvirus 2]AAM00780.1 chemokine vCXCL4 [Panine betaherpesvirus 2]QXV67896.1 chemokine vCXCL4 [Panine betaherpesvirus 2]